MAVSPYLTNDEFFRIALPGAPFRDLPPDTVTAVIQDASDMADGYFRKRFTLPMVSVGGDVKRQVAAIAAFDLLSRRGFRPDSGQDQVIVDRYEAAIEWFENVAKGLIEPSVVDSTPEVDEDGSLATSGGGAVNFHMTTGRRRCNCGQCDDCDR